MCEQGVEMSVQGGEERCGISFKFDSFCARRKRGKRRQGGMRMMQLRKHGALRLWTTRRDVDIEPCIDPEYDIIEGISGS